jgi:hypothetical protein
METQGRPRNSGVHDFEVGSCVFFTDLSSADRVRQPHLRYQDRDIGRGHPLAPNEEGL